MNEVGVDYRVEHGGEPYDVLVTTSGRADARSFFGFISEVVEDPRFRPGMRLLVDHSSLDASTLESSDVRAAADLVKRLNQAIGASLVAIVAPGPLIFGLTRMFEVFTDAADLSLRAFSTRDDAAGWLRSERPDA